jgi:hypothetical protein
VVYSADCAGVSNSEACRVVGINRRTGTRWRYGRTILNTAGEPVHYPAVVSDFRCAKRRMLVLQVGVAELHHAFGPRQVPQRMRSEVGQEGALGQPVDDEIGCDAGQQGLTAVAEVP